MNNTFKKHKDYRNAYNNPSQFDKNSLVEAIETSEDNKFITSSIRIITALRDAEKDKANNSYKFITS